MTATNHSLFGAVVALAIKEPILVVPIALASHFALDVLPHFGMHTWEERQRHKKMFKAYFVVEGAALLAVFSLFWLLSAPFLVYVGSFVAMSPDFIWGYRFLVTERLGKKRPLAMNRFNQWHSDIQKHESIIPGLYIEVVIAILLAAAIIGFLA